jgi:hypothetical protein
MLIGSKSHFASVDNNPVLTLGDKHIKHVYYKNSLGMILDEQLKWDKHNDAQCNKNLKEYCSPFKRARLFFPIGIY